MIIETIKQNEETKKWAYIQYSDEDTLFNIIGDKEFDTYEEALTFKLECELNKELKKSETFDFLGSRDKFLNFMDNYKTLKPLIPLEITWQPKEDITVYELATAIPLLFTISQNIPLYEENIQNLPSMRHFNVINHNK